MNSANTTARGYKKNLSFGIWCDLYKRFYSNKKKFESEELILQSPIMNAPIDSEVRMKCAEHDQKSTMSEESHNEYTHQVWGKSSWQFICQWMETS